METVRKAVDSLGYAFEEFKHTNNQRLKSLSSKGHVDPLVEEKLSALNQSLDKASSRLSRLEAVSSRPTLGSIKEGITPEDTEHKSAFLSYIRKGDELSLANLESKSLSVASDPDGGYVVPATFNHRIRDTLSELSTMRRLANVISISTDALEMLVDKGSADAGWISETDPRPETGTPKLSKIRIPVYEMYAKPRATQKLLDDAQVDLENWLSGKIAAEMAKMENTAFVHGTGHGKPRGFLSYPLVEGENPGWQKLQSLKTGVNGGFTEENGGDILIDLLNTLKPSYLNGAAWVMSRSALASVRKLKDNNGQYLWQPGLESDGHSKLLGHRVELCEDMPTLAAGAQSASIAFGNFKEGYQIVDRSGLKTLRDPFSSKPYVEFYTTRRVGGNVVDFDAIKVLNFSA